MKAKKTIKSFFRVDNKPFIFIICLPTNKTNNACNNIKNAKAIRTIMYIIFE